MGEIESSVQGTQQQHQGAAEDPHSHPYKDLKERGFGFGDDCQSRVCETGLKMPASPPSSASYHSCLTAFLGLHWFRFGLVLVLAEPIDLFCQKHVHVLSAYGYLSPFPSGKMYQSRGCETNPEETVTMGWLSWQSLLVDSWELGMNDQM